MASIYISNKKCKIYDSAETISRKAIIYGYSGSTAQTYAKKYNRTFKLLSTQSTTYTITYNANGGKNAPSAQTKQKNKTLTLSKTKPTKTGYTFLGWATSKSSTKVTYKAGASFKENKNITLYAVWKANTYKVAFNKNNGTGSMSSVSYTYGKSYTLKSNTFKRTGYTFKGWNTKANGTGKSYSNKAKVKNLTSVSGKIITLYAQWTAIKYSITYQLNGGTNNKANPASYNIATATITLKNPTKKGYTFGGWYTSSSYKTKVTKIAKGSIGNKNLYAKWTVNKYTIRYNKNGATSGSMADTKSCQYGKSYTLRKNTFTRTGYTFKGWNTKADGTGKSYADAAKVSNLSSVSGKIVTLYAQWEAKKYSITYQLNGGKNSTENPISYNITTATIILKNPTKKGYTFDGWYTSSSYKTKVTKITKGSTGNKTFYAKWTVNKYTIRYNGNGATSGKMSDTNSCQYGKQYTLRQNIFKRSGYAFIGWSKTANGSVKYKDQEKVKNVSSVNGKIVTLYAVWESEQIIPEGAIAVSTPEQLAEIAKNLSGHYVLTADIDLSEREWIPIGMDKSMPFSGILDGAGHSITGINMTDSTKEYTGLIGYSLGATVQNLTVSGTIHLEKPNGSRMRYAGGICAYSEGGLFSDCNNKVNINILNSNNTQGTYVYAGGIVGAIDNRGTISNCVNFTDIKATAQEGTRADAHAGGIAGQCANSSIVQSSKNIGNIVAYAAVKVSTYWVGTDAGGIVGSLGLSNVIECINEGAVKAEAYAMEKTNYNSFVSAGGLVGRKNKNDKVDGNNLSKDISANGNEFVQIYTGDLVGRSIG